MDDEEWEDDPEDDEEDWAEDGPGIIRPRE